MGLRIFSQIEMEGSVMKKACLLFALLFVFCSLFSAFAADRPTVLSFTELYSRRLIELENSAGIDLSSSFLGFDYPVLGSGPDNDGLIRCFCSAGIVAFDLKSLNVMEWNSTLLVLNDDPQKTVKSNLQCAVAISALEYDSNDELMMYGDTPPYLKAYSEIIDPIMGDIATTARKLKAQNRSMLIYEGKYNYYISCSETSDGRDMVMILAE